MTDPTSNRSRWLWTLCAIAIVAFTLIESSMAAPSVGSPTTTEDLHVVAHFLIFGSLAFCGMKAWGRMDLVSFAVMAAAALLFGISDEVHQMFVSSRDASLKDVFVDMVGALVGASLPLLIRAALKARDDTGS